ncbi:xanthine dehydrogenase subunit XdhC [Limisalsivibrio acetivorans]|uniref:xanthine dehydrogenase subunit XdhC n=1 Tax=Limisalsivibrio acetivorans TaxID=1304888 RepID=UPI0003B6711E|nr:xanthine dehydrogenase subunit XdhC [Limisalsivibrio acetivorans]
MTKEINLRINGEEVTIDVDIRLSLLDLLRDEGYTSVKQGCGVGECGACTVLIDQVPTDACMYLAVWADGKEIRTSEGEGSEGKLSRVQQAYIDAGAVQCGYCTPGFIMTSTAFVEKHKGEEVDRETIRREHAGNLCRCTGYETIICAVEACLNDKE